MVINPLRHALRIAGTLELAGMDLSFNVRRMHTMQKSSAEYLSGLGEAHVIEARGRLRPCTPDGLPIISRLKKFENLIGAAGHAMLDMSLEPITRKLVSQLASYEKPDMNVTSLAASRF